MQKSLLKILDGYQFFRNKYAHGDSSVMQQLSDYGQKPEVMVVACCDSRVDPALILQSSPGELFVVRNVANIVPPYEKDGTHHGTSAALEFGIRFLKVEHLILLGHSQCSGIQALLNNTNVYPNDFISNWVSIIKSCNINSPSVDECAKVSLDHSYDNCLTFPWIREQISLNKLIIHRWFFEIKEGQIYTHSDEKEKYSPLIYPHEF